MRFCSVFHINLRRRQKDTSRKHVPLYNTKWFCILSIFITLYPCNNYVVEILKWLHSVTSLIGTPTSNTNSLTLQAAIHESVAEYMQRADRAKEVLPWLLVKNVQCLRNGHLLGMFTHYSVYRLRRTLPWASSQCHFCGCNPRGTERGQGRIGQTRYSQQEEHKWIRNSWAQQWCAERLLWTSSSPILEELMETKRGPKWCSQEHLIKWLQTLSNTRDCCNKTS